MGKLEVEAGIVEPSTTDALPCCCKKSSWKWLLPVVLGIYVLAFALWLICFHGSRRSDSLAPPSAIPYIEASFRLRRPVTAIHESLQKLQVDLQDEIGIPDTQIDIISMVPLYLTNWTEVRFTVTPDRSSDSIAPAEMSLLKDTFVELFMQRAANLSLTSDVFGRVSHFEVLHFPGGITVVPDQPGFPLSKVVLFNFTLHNSLSYITCNFAEFRKQLASGIILKPKESLFVQLTNLEGSTLKPPLIVQTSILPVVGIMLPAPRLKQLAQEIMGSPSKNLGLNDTLFGRVKEVELSSYLQYSLEPAQSPGPSPGPSPSPAPSFSDWPRRPYNSPRRGGSRRHHSPVMAPSDSPYSHIARAPASEGSVAGWRQHHHHNHHAEFALAPSPSSSPVSPPTPISSYLRPQHSSDYGVPTKPPLQSISAHTPSYPGPISGPLEWHERIVFVPVASPTSSAVILGVPTWGIAVLLALLIGIYC